MYIILYPTDKNIKSNAKYFKIFYLRQSLKFYFKLCVTGVLIDVGVTTPIRQLKDNIQPV